MNEESKTGPNTGLQKWADSAMYTAEPVPEGGPRVYLLSATPDPLGEIASAAEMYVGNVIRDKSEVTHVKRQAVLGEMQKTKIKAPLEFVQFHFLIEGVTRGFTHQMVRQRTATYVQESTRFAVKGDMPVGLPPSLAGTMGLQKWRSLGEPIQANEPTRKARWRGAWDTAMETVQEAYEYCVSSGMPAEDARGLLPTNLLTRIHYRTDLRALLDHAGNRLCTQAQFEWRIVFAKMAEAIRNYDQFAAMEKSVQPGPDERAFLGWVAEGDRWQWEAIAALLQPVCYQIGKCAFEASFDRACSIRDRVQRFAAHGITSNHWSKPCMVPVRTADEGERGQEITLEPIQPREWLADPGAAR